MERVKSLRSVKIFFWNYLLVNKLFCSKNKKIVPDQTAFNFLYISLHASSKQYTPELYLQNFAIRIIESKIQVSAS